jgi:uncharacterized repeat protein (TIGR03803 family)
LARNRRPVFRFVFAFDGKDGAQSTAALTYVPGNGPLNVHSGPFYGATEHGGAFKRGTVFSVTTTGKEKVIHRFGNSAGAYWPLAGLTTLNGQLYGTTTIGGGGDGCVSDDGCGAVYGLTIDGKFRSLHAFRGGSDGGTPQAGLTVLNGILYGTTEYGGVRTPCQFGMRNYFFGHPQRKRKHPLPFQAHRRRLIPCSRTDAFAWHILQHSEGGGPNNQGTVFAFTP